MTFAMLLAYIKTYYIWILAVGLVIVFWCLHELQEGRRGRKQTIFALERELASAREGRARLALVTVVALLAVVSLLRFAVVPPTPLPSVREPTSTQVLILLPSSTPAPPTPTRTRIPTRPKPTALPPTQTPLPTALPAPPCPLPGVCISSPASGEAIQGQVTIRGTASIEAFQFYKIEYGAGETPQLWNSIGEVRRTAVVDGTLAVWDVTGFPPGLYKLRLTVVDVSGNFPSPYEIRVVVRS